MSLSLQGNKGFMRGMLLTAITIASAIGSNVFGQDDETRTYTRVAMWQVKRANWDDFTTMFDAVDKPVMEQLFADGVITEWGYDAMSVHKADGYTHSTWFSADSYEKLESVWDVYDAFNKKLGEKKAKENDVKFAGMVTKHRDYLVKTDGQRAKAASLSKAGYFKGNYFEVKDGKFEDFMSFYNNRLKSVYEQLLGDGTIVSYGISDEEILTESGGYSLWFVASSAAALDKVRAAFEAERATLDKEGRRARWASIKDVIEVDTFRQGLTNIIYYQVKDM